MSGRDLLNKPPVPIVLPDEQAEGKEGAAKNAASQTPKIRDIGQEDAAHIIRTALLPTTEKTPAHKAAYFNKDFSNVHQVNQRTSQMQALRGSDQAMDLKKITLPPPGFDIHTPNPEHLKDTLQRTGTSDPPSLLSLLSKQGAWAQSQQVTAEILGQRMLQLQQMFQLRTAALTKMALLPHKKKHPTLNATSNTEDNIEQAATDMITHTAQQGSAMLKRILKALGIKP